MNRAHAPVLFVVLAGSVVLAACGGAAESSAPAKAPAGAGAPADSAPEPEPKTIAEAQDQIDRLRADLSTDLKKSEADKDTARTAPGSGASTSSTASKPATSPAVREEAAKAESHDRCASSCRAITSMRRAVTALCRMTGDEDSRCSDARKTLSESESRVAQCHCGT